MHGNILFITGITSYNMITLILTDNKLTGPNYVDWKRNMDIVLIVQQLKWVTREVALPIPNEFST